MRLNHTLLSMIDYHMAKNLMWNPQSIDLTTDKTQWPQRSEREQAVILTNISLFHAGEEAVASQPPFEDLATTPEEFLQRWRSLKEQGPIEHDEDEELEDISFEEFTDMWPSDTGEDEGK